MKTKIFKTILKTFFTLILCSFLILCGYTFYLQTNYYRIKDGYNLTISNNSSMSIIDTSKTYKINTYNLGFGAYSREYSFFLDFAYKKDTNKLIKGKYGKAISKDEVKKNTQNSLKIIKENPADFYLFQEIDKKASRSFNVDMVNENITAFPSFSNVYASNFHTKFLAYPLHDMHGYAESGLLTISNINISSATRYSFPVTSSFINKFFDLDRCFLVTRFNTDNNKELVIINVHMSAYDKGGLIRKKQLERLNEFLESEYKKGNYIIVGGDYNHDYAKSKNSFTGNKKIPEWIYELDNNDLFEGFSFVIPENKTETGTCRGAEEPYSKENSYQSIIDGFIISDNIEANSKIIDTEYLSSDHNPVHLEFNFKE